MELATIDSAKWTLDNGPRDTESATMAFARIVSITMSLAKMYFATMASVAMDPQLWTGQQ